MTGIYKEPVRRAVFLGKTHLEGDGQADLRHHGGPDKAVLAFSAQHYPRWRALLRAPDLPFGAFGENFTVEGVTEGDVCVGDVYEVGEALVQVSQPRRPCWKLARRLGRIDAVAEVEASGTTGWYLRVLRQGFVEAGLPLRLVERPRPAWTIARANEVWRETNLDEEALAALASLPELSEEWRRGIERRLATRAPGDASQRLQGPIDDA